MVKMIPAVMDMLKRPDTNKVLVTISPEGDPHGIVCGSLLVVDEETIIAGEVYMYRTRDNLEHNSKAEFLVWSGKNAYSIQAKATSCTESGHLLDKININLEKMKMKADAVWEFKVIAVYDESVSGMAGTRII